MHLFKPFSCASLHHQPQLAFPYSYGYVAVRLHNIKHKQKSTEDHGALYMVPRCTVRLASSTENQPDQSPSQRHTHIPCYLYCMT